jgi:hypothetical protein
MAENIVAVSANSSGSIELGRSPRGWELVKLTGTSTAVADTSNVYTCKYLTKPAVIVGAFTGTFSGNTVVFTARYALGSTDTWVLVGEAL